MVAGRLPASRGSLRTGNEQAEKQGWLGLLVKV
jgi:hypothetical protein